MSLALIQHLHLPENPTPNVARLLLNDLKCQRGEDTHTDTNWVSQTPYSLRPAPPPLPETSPVRNFSCVTREARQSLDFEVLESGAILWGPKIY